MFSDHLPLSGRVALVAGATRGAGRGQAVALGEAGATVYCTGRSSRARPPPPRPPSAGSFELRYRPETIEETAELVTEAGGIGIACVVDHTDEQAVIALARRIADESSHLDILIDDVWGGDSLTQWGTPPWGLDLERARTLLDRALWSHLVTLRHLVPLVLAHEGGMILEVTDGEGLHYRGNLIYDLVKTSVVRLAFGLSEELRGRDVTVATVTPGFLRSEAMLEHFGVGEEDWREGGATDPHFLHSESPGFLGRAVVALAIDPDRRRFSGQVLSSWRLAREYGFTDQGGERPDWGRHVEGEDFGKDEEASAARYLAAFPPHRPGREE